MATSRRLRPPSPARLERRAPSLVSEPAARRRDPLRPLRPADGPDVQPPRRPIGVWQCNIADATTRWNAELYQVLGLDRGGLQPTCESFLDRLHPDDRESAERCLAETVGSGRPGSYEARVRCAGGEFRAIEGRTLLCRDARGCPTVLIGTVEDATERLRTESVRKASEARLRSILDNMGSGLVSADENYVITYANAAANTIFGYRDAELVGQHLSVLFPAPERANDGFLRLLESRAIDRRTELEGRRKSGELFPFEVSLFDFHSADVRQTAGCIRDLTESRVLEQLKKEFVATVSHELRTPLTSIRGSLTLLTTEFAGKLSEQARELVTVAERNCIRLIGLINDILDLEKLGSGKMKMCFEAFPLSEIVERSVEAVRGMAQAKGISVVARPATATVFCDWGRLIQVLVNLLSNAIKFSPAGSAVTLSTRQAREFVEVIVRDRGRGVPPEAHRLVFEPFKQVEASDARLEGGSGLGLAISKTIVEQHGGSIGLHSRQGRGSAFWFRVPAVQSEATASAAAPAAAAPRSS